MGALRKRRVTRREYLAENYHGVNVADPFRWLEDDTSPEVQEWMAEQNSDFDNWVKAYGIRDELRTRFKQLFCYAKQSVPKFVEGWYYNWRNDGLKNQPILYRSKEPCGEGEPVYDPNKLSKEGTVAVQSQSFSPKGRYFAYGLATHGSDWQVIKVLDLATLEELPDTLKHMKFSDPVWLPDESGFFYSRFPEEKATVLTSNPRNSAVYLHKLGQSQEHDRLIHKDDEHPDWNFRFSIDGDNKWAFLHISVGTQRRNQLWFKPLDKLESPWMMISSDFADAYELISVIDDRAYMFTQKDAPFGSVICADLNEGGAGNYSLVIPDQGEMLHGVRIINGQFFCSVLRDAIHHIVLRNLDGSYIRDVELPAMGSLREFTGRQKGNEFFVQYSSFLRPDCILRYDYTTQELKPCFTPELDFPFGDYETVQEFYTSKDGTRIPMFITKRKGAVKDGGSPAVLFGYGGYNLARFSAFSPQVLAWLEKGGIHVEPNIRGADEYGEAWHRGGMLESKQNCFDDFIAASEYLISEGYTSKEKLGIIGRSNGGLLTGVCVTQRPDLFGAVVVAVPVLDMLRYQHFTAGHSWIGEFGCSDDPEQFKVIYKYSPLHNVKMNTVYPPTLVMTADTDDRVVPLHARKFTATMQAADAGDNPIFIRIDKDSGHGHGKPIGKLMLEQADIYSFFFINLCGMEQS